VVSDERKDRSYGYPLVAERAGHARASMSLDVYSHVMPLDEVSADRLTTLVD
jgi:hypothetical protein